MGEAQYLCLTTIGRKTGQLREIEIWFTHSDGRFYVIAEYDTSNWLQNIGANPAVEVRVDGRKFSGVARLVDAKQEPDLSARIEKLSREKYGWGEGQIVELAEGDGRVPRP